MSQTQFAMNTKKGDYRIVVWHPGIDENTDYIKISTEDAEAVMAKTKTGPQVIREMFLKSRMAEVGEDAGSIVDLPPDGADDKKLGAEVPTGKPTGPATGGLPPSNEGAGNQDQPIDFSKMTVSGLSTLLVRDLRAFAALKGVTFDFGIKKEKMIEILAAKMQEEPAAPAAGPVTE